MAIPPIAGVSMSGLGGVAGVPGLNGASGAGAAKKVDGAIGGFVKTLENLQATQDKADGLAVQAATGDLNDIHAYTIKATEAALQTELTVAVRNRAVEAFNEIMRMPV